MDHEEKKIFVCSVWQKPFGQKVTFTISSSHPHQRQTTCMHCISTVIARKKSLKGESKIIFYNINFRRKHLRKHAQEKLFVCDICEKAFPDKAN